MLVYQNYHRHSHYTNTRVPDSVVTNEDYAKRAVELGQAILSSCEHGWQGNYAECYDLAKANGLKLLFASEAYWVKDRLEKDKTNCHIFLAAKNERGRQALNDVLSEANISGFYNRPRVDLPLLLSLPSDDIWCTSACIAGWLYEDADECWKQMADHFGKNFFLEVQYHNCDFRPDSPFKGQADLNQHILELSRSWGVPIIMGCDSHYILPSDAQARTDYTNSKGITYEDEEGMILDFPDGDTAYQRFAQQAVLSHDEIMEAINNTNVFAEVEEYDSPIFNTDIKMPSMYPGWTQEQKDEEYKRLVLCGWEEYKSEVPEEQWPHYEEEIAKEMQVVIDTKMADYFILNYHVIKRGKENGGWLTKTGRGSCVSFITNKLLGFTEVDRIAAPVHMYPERFMTTERILKAGTCPDIDFNVAEQEPFAKAQQEVLGEDHAYPMLAYGTMLTSAAWKLYAKAQDIPFELANTVSEQIKRYETAVKHADEDEKDDIDVYDYISSELKEVFEGSKGYRGIVSSWSVAPCAYLLYSGNIRKEIGLVRIKDHLCCCMDGHWAERCHFLKNDLLIVSVWKLIYEVFHRLGTEPFSVNELLQKCAIDATPWDLYKRGATLCLNQVEKKGTSARVAKYHPTNISELSAFIAAIRPGFASMFSTFASRVPFSYGVKAFDNLIQTKEMPNSYVLYQEQEMQALHYAGIPMSECYTAIKNIAKKRKEKVFAYKDVFKKGFSKAIIEDEKKSPEEADELTEKLWRIIEDSASYIFNCVSGDTRLQRAGERNRKFQPTIDEMYRIMHDHDFAKQTGHRSLYDKYHREGYGNALSMCDDGRIRKNKIIDIVPSGVQQTFSVRTSFGGYVECTIDHQFPTPDGQKKLRDLRVGDKVFCKGKCEKCRDKYNVGHFKPYDAARSLHREQRDSCEICGAEYDGIKRFELHHKDLNRKNDVPENYQWLCVSCHKKVHYKANRRKVYEKGIPTYLDEIVEITPLRETTTYDIEMADPAHNFVTESGLVVSNCSHAYCVALDSLYEAWLKANHPLEFYEVALNLYEKKGDKDKVYALKEEAEKYFDILFPPMRYGQDNRQMRADPETNSIVNSLGSIKGMSKTMGTKLYECSQEEHRSFFDVLRWLDERSIKSAKVEPLIKIDYFNQFGNNVELLRLLQWWDFFKQGTAKTISKEKLTPEFEELLARHATDKSVKDEPLKSYKITDMDGLLKDIETHVFSQHLEELPYRVKAANQNDILGYVDMTTQKEEDRRKLYLLNVRPLIGKWNAGKPWKYVFHCKSVGSGKVSQLSVSPYLYNSAVAPAMKGDVILAKHVHKDEKGYWQLDSYEILPG